MLLTCLVQACYNVKARQTNHVYQPKGITMLNLKSLHEAEKFVTRQKSLGNDVRWDGWDIVFHRPAEKALYSKDGAFRGGQWGFENRAPLGDSGTWEVDYRNVKRAKRNRH